MVLNDDMVQYGEYADPSEGTYSQVQSLEYAYRYKAED